MRGFGTTNLISKNGIKSSRNLKNNQNNLLRCSILRRVRTASKNQIASIRQEMAMHFDNMFIDCLDSKNSLGKEIEVKHLKELVLLHLDLIEQQAEDLLAKDKIIQQLKSENENLRSHLRRIDQQIHAAGNDKSEGTIVKKEYKQPNNNNNNNNEPEPPDDIGGNDKSNNNCTTFINNVSGCLLPSVTAEEKHTDRVQSPTLRSQKQQLDSNAVVLSSNSSLSSADADDDDGINDRGVLPAPPREGSPCSRRVLRNASPILKDSVSIKEEFQNCSQNVINSNNRIISSNVIDNASPVRHSPRLDGVITGNSSSYSESFTNDCSSPTNSLCSTKKISSNISIKSDLSGIASSPSNLNDSVDNIFMPQITALTPNVASNKFYKKSFSSSCLSKSFAKKSRRTRSDTSHSEHETSDTDSKSDLRADSPAEYIITRQQQHTIDGNNKRKSEATDDGPDLKKNKSLPSIDNKAAILTSVSLDYDSDGTTNHSLRSRDNKVTPNTSLITNTSSSNQSYLESPCKSDHDLGCRQFHSMSESSCDDEATKAPRDGGVSPGEYERVFVKSASEAASRLRDHNVKVPGCSVRPVRSAVGVLSTAEAYYLPTEPPPDLTEPSDMHLEHGALAALNKQVEIPRWRVCVLSSLYIMEGTENLEDEVFTKRHNKLEQDEKRRKRWDLQRLREQRQYEKLRERYEVRNSAGPSSSSSSLSADGDLPPCNNTLCTHHHLHHHNLGSTSAPCGGTSAGGAVSGGAGSVGLGGGSGGGGVSNGGGGGGGSAGAAGVVELASLWPDPDNALYLEVVERVPVCAFGQPCAVTPSSEFSLPWLRHPDELTARRRKR